MPEDRHTRPYREPRGEVSFDPVRMHEIGFPSPDRRLELANEGRKRWHPDSRSEGQRCEAAPLAIAELAETSGKRDDLGLRAEIPRRGE